MSNVSVRGTRIARWAYVAILKRNTVISPGKARCKATNNIQSESVVFPFLQERYSKEIKYYMEREREAFPVEVSEELSELGIDQVVKRVQYACTGAGSNN